MNYDAIVVGGGPAGSASAIEMARNGLRVVMIEKAEYPRRKVCGEFISATSIPVLERFGVAQAWRDLAGPDVRRVGLFAGERVVSAPMPRSGRAGFGRALGRDVLDVLLRDAAQDAGVEILQPCRATRLMRDAGLQVLGIDTIDGPAQVTAPVLIAAHGSWERSAFPCTPPKLNTPLDMMGFKAHFHGATMAGDLMPLLSFPGGYGGMVWADDGRLSLSCCLRRDALDRVRQTGETASDAVHRHLMVSCRGIREVLGNADLAGPWLATGPIRPGIRPRYENDIYRVGNVAGEAHPVIAEGISMAIQSGWLLADQLIRIDLTDPVARAKAGAAYARAWHGQFAGRIRAADALARITMRPEAFSLLAALIEAVPSILTLGARLSGKSKPLPLSSH